MRILFVCTGNTCRSAMAESIARDLAAERGLTEVDVSSAGVHAMVGSPASDGAMLVAMERGRDLSAHRSRQITRDMVAAADLVLAMGHSHLDVIESLGGAGKAHLLSSYASRGAVARPVNDPYGGELSNYRETYDELEHEIRRVLDRIAAEPAPGRQ